MLLQIKRKLLISCAHIMAAEVWTDPRFHGSHIVSGFEFELEMFCSSCGQNSPLEAKYCHKCGDLLKHSVTEGAGCVDEGSKKMKVAANKMPLKVALEHQGC